MKIVVIGTGLAGLTTAYALGKLGLDVTLCGPMPDGKNIRSDGRSTALLDSSVSFLKELDLWENLQKHAFPLKVMRIIDDTDRLVRAPQVDFNAKEIGLDAFGYNILNDDYIRILFSDLTNFPNVGLIDQNVNSIHPNDVQAAISFEDGKEDQFDMVLACDGRNSITRLAYGLDLELKAYPQYALVGNVTHERHHNDISTEFHTKTGPFTLVPLGEKQSSFVCVETKEQVEQLERMDGDNIARELEIRMHSILGKTSLTSSLKYFPLSYSNNSKFARNNMLLIGESGHVLPPIGAQGFNIGIRDIKSCVRLISRKLDRVDFKPEEIAESYQKDRLMDVKSRTTSVDLLNRSLLSDFLPVQIARSFGLYALSSFTPLRHFAMREGIEPGKGKTSFSAFQRSQ